MTGYTARYFIESLCWPEFEKPILRAADKDRLDHEVLDLQTAIAHVIPYWGDTKEGLQHFYQLWKKAGEIKHITKEECLGRLPTSEWVSTWYRAMKSGSGGAWVGRRDKRTVLTAELEKALGFFEPAITYPKTSKYPENVQGNLFQFNDKDGHAIIVAMDPPMENEIGLLTKKFPEISQSKNQ